MMRRKIKTSMILVCVLFTMLFTGCGKQADEDKTDEEKTNEVTNNDTTASSTEDDIITDSNADIVVGDYVTFGVYEQDNDNTNGLEPIKWQVMDVSDGKALLVSCYILDNIEYNESEGVYGSGDSESNPWSQSYVYSWLNKDFAQTAFSEEELKIITDATDYSVTDEYGAFEGELIGSVFLPSYDEITKYFGTKTITITNYKDEEEEYTYSDMLLCKATPYANDERKIECETFTEETYNELKEKGFEYDSSVIGNEYSAYWLRSSLSWDSWFTAEGHALLVEEDGRIELGTASLNNEKTRRHGIRPCVWAKLEEADNYLTVTDGTEEDWFANDNGETDASSEESVEDTTEYGVDIDVYELLRQIHTYPMYFLVDTLPDGQQNSLGTSYAVTDSGDGYTVTGTVKACDVILKNTGIENMDDGDTVTSVLGTEYTVTYNDHANNGNWIDITMEDEVGNVYYIRSGQSGENLSRSYVYIYKDEEHKSMLIKTYKNVSFEVPAWSALIYPSGIINNIGEEELVDYQGMYMDDDGVIHSNNLPENSASPIYDENGNVLVD